MINRRSLMKFLAMPGGMAIAAGIAKTVEAATGLHRGRVMVHVKGYGGVDQSSFADPRENPKINPWAEGGKAAGVAGRIRYAPMGANEKFFQKYYQQMLVVNGLHSETNSHPLGHTIAVLGTTNGSYPQLADLFAAQHGPNLAFPLIQHAWYTLPPANTLVRASGQPSVALLKMMSNPNASIYRGDDFFFRPADVATIQAARLERLRALERRADQLPRMREAIAQYLDTLETKGILSSTPQGTNIKSEVHAGMLAVSAGLTSSVQYMTGNFDSHGDHVNNHNRLLPNFTGIVDEVWTYARELGIEQRIFVRVFSEFGRTPWINGGMGKDHWSINSEILMEANPTWGNRVYGVSGPRHEEVKINLRTGLPDPNGRTMRRRQLHHALREYLGIGSVAQPWDLNVSAEDRLTGLFDANVHSGYPNL